MQTIALMQTIVVLDHLLCNRPAHPESMDHLKKNLLCGDLCLYKRLVSLDDRLQKDDVSYSLCKRMMHHILFANGLCIIFSLQKDYVSYSLCKRPIPIMGGPEASISKYLDIEIQQPCRYISAKVSEMPTLGKLQTSTPSYIFTNLHIRLKSNMISLPKILSFWCEILTWEDISKCRSALRSNDLLRRRHSADFPSAKRARLTLIKQLWGQNFHLIQGYT